MIDDSGQVAAAAAAATSATTADAVTSGAAAAAATGQFYDAWNLDDESKGYLQAKGIKDPANLVKIARDTESFVGLDKSTIIKIPKAKEGETPDFSEVYNALGRPEKPEDYGFTDSEDSKFIAPEFHKLGITKVQAEGISKIMKTLDEKAKAASEDASVKKFAEQESALKTEWGADFNVNREVAKKAAQDAVERLGLDPDAMNKLGEVLGLDKSLKLFYALGKTDDAVKSLDGYAAGKETPEIAKYKIAQLHADPETAAKISAGDYKTVTELNRLSEIMITGQK